MIENRLDKQALFVIAPFVGIALIRRHKEFPLFETLEDRFDGFVLGSGLPISAMDRLYYSGQGSRTAIYSALQSGKAAAGRARAARVSAADADRSLVPRR